jgi:hypothetical protein
MSPHDHPDTRALEQAWSALIVRAECRIRHARARSGLVAGAFVAVPLAALAAASAASGFNSTVSLSLIACAVTAPAVGWLVGRFRPLAPAVVHARIDRQFGLADEALAARELADHTSPAWRAAILRQAVAHTSAADWNSVWPVRWPRRTGFATGSALLAALLAFVLLPRSVPAGSDPAAALRAEQHTALAELAKDWEKTAEDLKGEEWNAFRETLTELQTKLADQNLSERELLVALARVESKLAEATAAVAESGVSNHAEDLADALAGIEGMEAAAKALKERDLAAAASALDKAAASLAAADAKLAFKDGTGAEAAKRLAQLSDKAAKKGDSKLAESAKKLSEAAKAGDCKSAGECSASHAEQSREAAAKDSARASLASVSRSLSEARLALAEGKKPGDASESMSLAMQGQTPGRGPGGGPSGNGIGDGAGDHSPGAENALDPTARKESLTGTANAEGESIKRTIKASEAAPSLAANATEAEIAEFTRLSREAVEDESLPLEHRRSIHRYFQLIRPSQETPSPVSKTP